MIIVRYGEIGLKSPQTRKVMEDRLVSNIKSALGDKKVIREPGRIFVASDSLEDAQRVSRVFGVVSTSLALKISSRMEEMLDSGTKFANERIVREKSFAVRARRKGRHNYKSMDVGAKLGSAIVESTGASVDLKTPDVTIYVEIRDRDAYLFDSVIQGVGGLPLGTQGKALALISGGIDSPVAAWMLMKRGVEIEAVFMDCRPLVDDRTIERAIKTIETLSDWANAPIKTYVVPYGDALLSFLKYGDNKLGCILCKRMMYMVAERIVEEEKAFAVITGESLGQVASQTLQNINALESMIGVPVFRPLIAMDKTEIVDYAKMIGTYDLSIQPANCCLGPPLHPETRATRQKVSIAEETLDMKVLVNAALEKIETLEVGNEKS